MQLAGDAAALGQRGRGSLALACVLELGHQQFGAVLALPAAAEELADHRQQQAHQRRGDGLRGRVRGQADGHGERGGDRSRRGGGRSGREPDRGDPDSHRRGQVDRPVRLPGGQRHPGPADQPDHHGLRGQAAASPADADRGRDRCRVHGQGQCHAQVRAPQTRRGRGLHAGRHHDRDERPAQRPQRPPLDVTALAGPGSRLRHPGRSGLPPGRGRGRPGPRGAMTKARRGQPCLHRHRLARGGPGDQIRHGCRPGSAPGRRPGPRPAGGRAAR